MLGEEPLGFAGIGGNILTDESTGGHWLKDARHLDRDGVYRPFDLTSQLNRFFLVQTGAELIYSDYEMDYASINIALAVRSRALAGPGTVRLCRVPLCTGKLEFQGMIANLGVRLDYFDPNTEWWQYGPYEGVFASTGPSWTKNWRPNPSVRSSASALASAFPSDYGKQQVVFQLWSLPQMMDAYDVLGIRQSKAGGIDELANPEHPLPKTVAYELGFDQNVLDHSCCAFPAITGHREQTRTVNLTSLGGVVNYSTKQPWNYSDTRGAEFSISKNRGRWIQGFANFTYQQSKSGNFGYSNFLRTRSRW